MSIDPIERKNLLYSAGAVAASYALLSPGFAWSLGLGALLEAVNFRALRRSGEMLFAGEVPARRFGSAGFASRFLLLGVAIGVAIYAGAHPIGLVTGLSLIIPAVIIEAWRTRPAIDPSAPELPADDEGWDLWNPWLALERDPADEEEEDGSSVTGIDLTADLKPNVDEGPARSQGETDR